MLPISETARVLLVAPKKKIRKKTETIFCTWTWMENRYLVVDHNGNVGLQQFQISTQHLLSSLAACVPAQTVLVKWHSASNLFSLACTPDIMNYLSWGIQGTWKPLQITGKWGRHQEILCIQSQKKSFANLPFSNCLLKIGKDQPDKGISEIVTEAQETTLVFWNARTVHEYFLL